MSSLVNLKEVQESFQRYPVSMADKVRLYNEARIVSKMKRVYKPAKEWYEEYIKWFEEIPEHSILLEVVASMGSLADRRLRQMPDMTAGQLEERFKYYKQMDVIRRIYFKADLKPKKSYKRSELVELFKESANTLSLDWPEGLEDYFINLDFVYEFEVKEAPDRLYTISKKKHVSTTQARILTYCFSELAR